MIGWLAAWSNHFDSGFHFDDFPVIVNNQSVHQPSNIPKFFTNPRISSADTDSAAYRPLLTSSFAVDYWLGGGSAKPFIFQSENFLWFLAVLVVMFALFRLILGVAAAGFATLLFGLHPVMADTVNYALQRGVLMGSFGVIAGLLIWIYWPRYLPPKLPLKLKRVPQHGFDAWLRDNFQRLEGIYLKIVHAPAGLYLWPVVPALLAEPATAVFAPILIAYIILFESDRKIRDAIPAVIICGGYWIFQLIFTWNIPEFSRPPALNYWLTQPWVAMRYLFKFFVPLHLSADSDLPAFANVLDARALAGYLGVAALVALAVLAGRRPRWRAVSFGLWWFLLALLPGAVVPHRVVEADWRMFLPYAGLALSLAGMASIAVQTPQRGRALVWTASGVMAAVLLGLLGWATRQRTAVWESEETLWSDVMAASPHNGRGFMNYGLTQLTALDPRAGFDYLSRAAVLAPHDPLVEINLALAWGRLGESIKAERQFKSAIADAPFWSPAYSSYGQWLMSQSRVPEAFDMSSKALALDSRDLVGRRTLMDVMAQNYQWQKLKQFADETLRLYPDDPDAARALEVSQSGLDQLNNAERAAKSQPTADNYLALSVLYFQAQRYDDCITAAREALKVNPNQAEAYANIAAAYHTLGKLDETIAALTEEVRLNPNLRSAKANLETELALKKTRSEAR